MENLNINMLIFVIGITCAVSGFIGIRIFKAIDQIFERLTGLDKEVAVLVDRARGHRRVNSNEIT